MKTFKDLSKEKPTEKRSQYKRPPSPIPTTISKSERCRIVPLLLVQYPEFIQLPYPAYTSEINALYKVLYNKLILFKKHLQI